MVVECNHQNHRRFPLVPAAADMKSEGNFWDWASRNAKGVVDRSNDPAGLLIDEVNEQVVVEVMVRASQCVAK